MDGFDAVLAVPYWFRIPFFFRSLLVDYPPISRLEGRDDDAEDPEEPDRKE